MPKKIGWIIVGVLILVGAVFFMMQRPLPEQAPPVTTSPPNLPATPTFTPALIPQTIPIENSPLKDSIIAAGDYLVRQQLVNGELSYQVDFMTDERAYTPSYIRLVAGAGSLYTVCRVSGNSKYCEAGDLALDHYLEMLVSDPNRFTGTCLYTNGGCPLGGAALTVDAIYKRWQATGGFILEERNLLTTAMDLGYFIVSMRKPDGSETQVPAGGKFSGTDQLGIYVANPGNQQFVVNLDPEESRTSPLARDRLAALGLPMEPSAAAQSAKAEAALHTAASEAEQKQKLWRWLVVAALIILLAETAVAARLSAPKPNTEATP